MMSPRLKVGLITLVHIIVATEVFRYLITGGWLTNHYQLNDPNIVNLVLAIFEPIAIVSVIAYWLFAKTGPLPAHIHPLFRPNPDRRGFSRFHSAFHVYTASETDLGEYSLCTTCRAIASAQAEAARHARRRNRILYGSVFGAEVLIFLRQRAG